jgi:hypothetical protein
MGGLFLRDVLGTSADFSERVSQVASTVLEGHVCERISHVASTISHANLDKPKNP